jgi:hypothetical protein
MPISLRFTSSSQANGLTASAFARSSAGVGLFFNFRESATVSGDTAQFASISAPGEYAFLLAGPSGGPRFRSGPQSTGKAATDTFMIVDAGTSVFSPAALSSMLPTPPVVSGSLTVTSISLAVGSGSMTASGTASHATPFGPIPVTYTYVFTIDPVGDAANYNFPGGIPPSVDVRTITLNVVGTAGGPLGWLVNALAGAFASLFHGSIVRTLESTIQARINAAVAAALASSSAPAGTVATVESVSIAPTVGLTLRAWAGFSLERACAMTPSGGSINVRSSEQLTHLRIIRDRVLRGSPQGIFYIELYEHFSSELVRILLEDEDLLRRVDAIVARVLEHFSRERPGEGRLSAEAAEEVRRAMGMISRVASP